jgi:lipopolysaccharide export system permease protein
MKTLHVYLLREVLATLLMTVAVFTFVLLIGNVLKDILPLLLNRQVGLLTVGKALLLLIPFVLAFSLPMGMLTATLLVFGRFSADQELTAARASGISLLSLASPIVAFSLLLCLLCACINLHIAPVCRVAFNQMRVQIGIERANQGLPEDQFITDFDNTIVYVGKSDTNTLKNVMILLTPDDTNSTLRIHAPRGTYSVDPVTRKVEVHLFEAKSVFVAPGKWAPQYLGEWTYSLTPRGDLLRAQGTKLRNMTFLQLQAELRSMKQRIAASSLFRGASPSNQPAGPLARRIEELTTPILVQMNRQLSFSFACFGFTLLGIPLAIRVHRRETNIGFAIALGLVTLYYSFLIAGDSLSTQPQLLPSLILWFPNFLFQAVGGVLLWRANRGG